MDIMKKTKIEQYLQGPLWALLILAFVDIVFVFLGYSMWSDLSGLTSRSF